MIEFLANHILFVWIAVAVIFAVAEGLTASFVTIWFAIGGAASAAMAAAGAGIALQVIIFFVVSISLLIFTRPILVKKLKLGREKNYTEQLEGKTGLVTEAIKPFGSGQVKVRGIVWTAVGESEDFSAEQGNTVQIVRIEGVKLIVRAPVSAEEDVTPLLW
jgi:membrane protein implicated in regulation of membrane protease activity